jgi:RecA-family ATPase
MTDSLLDGMRDGAWLDAQEFPELQWAVPGIVPEGFGLIVAPPKAGKSWLVANLGLACACGGLALGRVSNATPRPVLYLALEDGHRRLQLRFRRIMLGDRIPPLMHVITQAQTFEVMGMIEEFAQQHHDSAPFIILDTLGKVKPPKQPGADGYQMDYAIGSRLKEAIDGTPGASLLVVHHTRKQESSDFVDAVSGTQGIAGSADYLLVLARKRHSNDATLSVTGRDVNEAEYALKSDEGLWLLDGDNLTSAAQTAELRRATNNRSDRSVDILKAVSECNSPVTAADVAQKLGLETDTVGRYMRRLADEGHIKRTGRGIYQSVSEVSETSITAGQLDISVSETAPVVRNPVSESTPPIRTTDTSDTLLAERQRIIAERLSGGHTQ